MTKTYLEVFRSLTEEQACERTFVDAHPAALCFTTDTNRIIFGGKTYYTDKSVCMGRLSDLAERQSLAKIKVNCGAYRVTDKYGNMTGKAVQYLTSMGTKVVQVLFAYQEDGVMCQVRSLRITDDLRGGVFSPWTAYEREMQGVTIDSHLDTGSANPVQNAAIATEIEDFENSMNAAMEDHKTEVQTKLNEFGSDYAEKMVAVDAAVETANEANAEAQAVVDKASYLLDYIKGEEEIADVEIPELFEGYYYTILSIVDFGGSKKIRFDRSTRPYSPISSKAYVLKVSSGDVVVTKESECTAYLVSSLSSYGESVERTDVVFHNGITAHEFTDTGYLLFKAVNNAAPVLRVPRVGKNKFDKALDEANEALAALNAKQPAIDKAIADTKGAKEAATAATQAASAANTAAIKANAATAANNAVAAEMTIKANQAAADAAEAKQAAQNATDAIINEAERVEAEAKREAAEEQRLVNETHREDNEADRESAEIARENAEAIRYTQEDNRQSNEIARKEAESERKIAETRRKQSETYRQEREAARDEASAEYLERANTAVTNAEAAVVDADEAVAKANLASALAVEKAGVAQAAADDIKRRADEGEFDGSPGPQGIQGPVGPAGPKGEPGQDGKDLSAEVTALDLKVGELGYEENFVMGKDVYLGGAEIGDDGESLVMPTAEYDEENETITIK